MCLTPVYCLQQLQDICLKHKLGVTPYSILNLIDQANWTVKLNRVDLSNEIL